MQHAAVDDAGGTDWRAIPTASRSEAASLPRMIAASWAGRGSRAELICVAIQADRRAEARAGPRWARKRRPGSDAVVVVANRGAGGARGTRAAPDPWAGSRTRVGHSVRPCHAQSATGTEHGPAVRGASSREGWGNRSEEVGNKTGGDARQGTIAKFGVAAPGSRTEAEEQAARDPR
jgi:hypothetical protein